MSPSNTPPEQPHNESDSFAGTIPSPLPSSPRVAPENPTPAGHPYQSRAQDRPLSEIIGKAFPSFDHQSGIVQPYNDETVRDLAFEQELSSMLLDAIIETHAWSSARPMNEGSIAALKIEQKIVSIMEAEREQGTFPPSRPSSSLLYFVVVERTRERLSQFVTQMKTALAALTGLGV